MTILLILIYGLACGYAIWKMPFVRRSGIHPLILLLLFGLHVVTGWVHNVISWRYFPEHGDIWFYFRMSFLFRHRLFHDFGQFLTDNSRWTYVSHNGMIYVQLLLNALSFGRLSVNTLLFSFPVFLGNIALFRVFRDRFPHDLLPGFAVFLLPSTLFWTAVIYREAMLYMLLGFFLFNLHRLLTTGYSPKRLFWCVGCFLLIGYFRGTVILVLFPALLVWGWLERPAIRRSLLTATLIGMAGLILLLVLTHYDLAGVIAERQHEFYSLEGHSRLPLPALTGSWANLFQTLPAAVFNGLFQPLPGSGGQPLYLAFALELVASWLVVVLALIKVLNRRRGRHSTSSAVSPQNARPLATPPAPLQPAAPHTASKPGAPLVTPFGAFCLVFAILGMVSIGLIVPFAGAIVRYRSIFLPFLLAPFLHSLTFWRPKHIKK